MASSKEPEPVIGIDVGFSKCVVGVYRTTGLSISRNRQGSTRIPSCVGIERGKFVVGENAQNLSLRKPHSVVFGIPRLLGKCSHLPTEQAICQVENDQIELKESSNGRLKVVLKDGDKEQEFSVVQLFGELLKHLVGIGNSLLTEPVTRIVITIPYADTDAVKLIRCDIRDSVKYAKLQLIDLVHEHAAVIEAYKGVDG